MQLSADGEREARDGEAQPDDFLHLLAAEGEDRIAETLLNLPGQPVEQQLRPRLGLRLRRQVNLNLGLLKRMVVCGFLYCV